MRQALHVVVASLAVSVSLALAEPGSSGSGGSGSGNGLPAQRAPAQGARPVKSKDLQIGPLVWRPGDSVQVQRRFVRELELTTTREGRAAEPSTTSREVEERSRVDILAAEMGRIERLGVRYESLVERSKPFTEPMRETHAPLEGESIVFSFAFASPSTTSTTSAGSKSPANGGAPDRGTSAPDFCIAREDGAPLSPKLTRLARERELSSVHDVYSGTRALEHWLSLRKFEPGVAVLVPDDVSLEVLRATERYDRSAMTITWIGTREGVARFTVDWTLHSRADDAEKLEALLDGTLDVQVVTAQVFAIDVQGTVNLAGAALTGGALLETSGRGRMELHETRAFSHEREQQ